jgi:gliding motility-associated-like protein
VNTGDTIFDILNLGETVIILTVFDENQCSIRDSIEVVPDLITNMVLNTFSSPETCWDMQDGTDTVSVQYGFGPITYQWDDPNMQTTAIATNLISSETYTVIVTDSIGCTLTTEVFIEPTIGCFYITNAITPNGDGSNDQWMIGGLEFFPNAKVQVVNRWGQVVFESTGYPAAWDGTYKGEPLPVADYYYIIDYSEEADPIMGTVTIKY